MNTTARQTTAVVVGAGLSGLVTAHELHRSGIDVVVLESADRVGGRTLAETSALGSRLDLGGQWIGHDHARVVELGTELGLTAFPMHSWPLPRLVDGTRRIRPVAPAVLTAGAALGVLSILLRVRGSARWADVPVSTWIAKVPGRRARRLLEVVALISWTGDLDRLSVQAMLSLIGRQGGLRTILSTKGGAQDSLLVEGAGSLAERLATGLGARVRTGHRVASIRRDDQGATVRTTSGEEFRAEHVVVTAPPPAAARITHEPALPAGRAAIEQQMWMGSVYKAIAVYDRPFWRGHTVAEQIALGRPGFAAFDSSPPGGPGHLCLLVGGPEAEEIAALTPQARQRTLLQALATSLGPATLQPAGWHEKSWHLDEHALGGYVALPGLGSTDTMPPLPSEPVGRVHWAGAETASDHPGYLDGAIESGRRAAHEILQALGATSSR